MERGVDIELTAARPAGGCGCGGHDEQDVVLDVRQIPHAVRHAAVLGAFGAVAPGGSLVLVAPHAPLPLLAQLDERFGITWEPLVEGPDEWRLRVTRRAA